VLYDESTVASQLIVLACLVWSFGVDGERDQMSINIQGDKSGVERNSFLTKEMKKCKVNTMVILHKAFGKDAVLVGLIC